jgi:hypothetical protein
VRPPLTALAPLVTALVWSAALVIEPGPFPRSPSLLLICVGMILCAAVSTAGMVVVGGRWAHRLGWLVVVTAAAIAVVRDVDLTWVLAAGVTLAAAITLVYLGRRLRRLPSATGPPTRAVLVPLILLAAPIALGMTATGPAWAALVIGLGAPLAALLYSRVIFGGLVTARAVWPLTALALSPFLEPAGIAVAIVLAVSVTVLAWHPSVKSAFHPPREVGSTFPIPPELAPREILDAARIDDTGSPR